MRETSMITPYQEFKGKSGWVCGIIYLWDRRRILTCSRGGLLGLWNLKSRKQIGEDWRDGKSAVRSIALSPDGKKVASSSDDGVRLSLEFVGEYLMF
jgi:WD40 repeat protein